MLQLTSVTVAVCTFRRNDQLLTLLTKLIELVSGPLGDLQLGIVVVDDDPSGGAEAVVRDLAAEGGGMLRYRHAGSANLSTARNTAIEEGLRSGEWLVFIDDDCLPHDEWLRHLLDVQERTSADMVTGHVVYRAKDEAPSWLVDEPFLDFTAYEDGNEPDFGTTANVLLSTRFLRDSGVRFRPTLGLTGGEDMTFYADARAAGANLRYSAKAIVYEPLTPSRERLRYHLHRQFWLGNNMVVINRHTHRESMVRLLVRGTKRAIVPVPQAAVRICRGQPAQFRWALAYALQGVGLVLGVLGVTVRHRP